MLNEQKVQFFNSQSSFGSQSNLADSRYFDLLNQISDQTENLFSNFKQYFLPTQQLTDFDKTDYLHNRAHILAINTIPQHLLYFEKISSSKQAIQICKQCQARLKKLIKDYQSLKKGEILHKQFYNLYGRSQQNNLFFKKDNSVAYNGEANRVLEPDVQSINQSKSTQLKCLNTNQTSRSIMQSQRLSNDKYVMQLQQQILVMKKREGDMRRQFDYILSTEKINCEKRINTLIKSINQKIVQPHSSELEKNYKNQTIRLGQELTKILIDSRAFIEKQSLLEQKNHELQNQLKSCKDQLAGYRKFELSKLQDQDQLNRSAHSDFNNGDDSKNIRKLQLQIKRLIYERDVLKHQLARQREIIEKDKQHANSDQSKQILRLKSYLETRNKQNEELYRQLDEAKVLLIQLKQQNKLLNKSVLTIKENIDQRNLALEYRSFEDNKKQSNNGNNFSKSSYPIISNYPIVHQNLLEQYSAQNHKKPARFQDYVGEGIEGHPYFQLLQKEFKIRFKRACLKNKQLLFKSNGLQIGVITQVYLPNIIKVIVHITNSNEFQLKGIHIKTFNPNENKIDCQIQKVQNLMPNQQLKFPVNCTIKNYPIGPVVFLLEYAGVSKHDLRLLLPVHIFKCVLIQPRSQQFYKATTISFKFERKICKNLSSLKQYLNIEQTKEIKVKIKHEHSNSAMFMNVSLNQDEIQIQYEHISGTEKFTLYFIKTFKILLQKQN